MQAGAGTACQRAAGRVAELCGAEGRTNPTRTVRDGGRELRSAEISKHLGQGRGVPVWCTGTVGKVIIS